MSVSARRTILLVEDEALIAMNEKLQLEKYGYSVRTATTGEQAVEAVRAAQDIDLILMDINLGNGIDGSVAAEMILRDRDIPIVFLSSHTEPALVEKTEKITSYGYVVKNSNIAVLDASIKMAFRLFDAREEIRNSEEKYRNLFENMTGEVHFWQLIRDEHGAIQTWQLVDANAAALRAWKKTRRETIGKTAEEIWDDPDVVALFRPVVEKVFGDENPYTWEEYFPATGQTLQMTTVAFGDYFISTGLDITERSVAEQRVARERERLETILETTADGFWIVNPERRITRVNSAYARMSGYTTDELTTMQINDLDAIEEAADTTERIRRIMEHGSETFETKHRRKDGSVFDVEVSASRLHRSDGNYLSAFCRDITDRKTAEAALRTSEYELKRAQAITRIGSWYLDVATNHVTWSEELYKMYGFDPTKPVPPYTEHMKLFTPESWHQLSTSLAHTRETGTPYELELRTVRNDGSNGWMWVRGEAVFDDEGAIVGLWGAAQDISDRKYAEEELQSISDMQSLFLRMASAFLNTPLEEMHATINTSLQEIGTFVGADRAYVFEYDWARNVANNTHEWCSDGVTPEIENLQGVPNEVMHHWVAAHRRGTEVSIENVLSLPATDSVRQILEPQGVRSVLALPMMNHGECIGFVGFDSVKEIRSYSKKEKILLTVFSEMLVNIGQRKELEQRLVQAKDRAEEKRADLTAMIEGTTQSIWAFDRNYEIRYINERFRSDFHAAFGTWLDIGSSLIEALPEALRPVWKPRYDRALANNRFIVTDEVETATGTTYIEVSFNPIVQGNRVIGGSCFGSDITDRKEAEIEIKKQLAEKETLLREVHHRVKNNMTMIESLLAMQADSSSLPAVKTALHETISRVQSSRVLYDKLLVSDDMNEISVERYANGLIDAIATVFDIENNVTIERQIADFRISQRNAFALGIIINELLTNLFKHAFKDHSGGAVSIIIERDEQTVRLIIHDNGVGFDESTLKNESSGFGLTVVKMLVEQSGGSFTRSNDNGARSVVYLNL